MIIIIVDFVVVCSRSHSENLKIPMQNPFSRPPMDSTGKEFQKSEIGLQIERSDTSSDCVCHACARKIRLHNFISSSLQKEKQAMDVPDDSSRSKCLLPTTVSSPDRCPVLFACRRSPFLFSDVRSCSLVLSLGRF